MTLSDQFKAFCDWLNIQRNITGTKRTEILTFIKTINDLKNTKFESIVELLRRYLRSNVTQYQEKKILQYIENRLELIDQELQ